MKNQVLFFHGGGSREDYEGDGKLVASLSAHLGPDYSVQYPYLPQEQSPDLGRREQIPRHISNGADDIILVAHSLGASMLLACLSELKIDKKITGIFLIATPFWQGDEDWVQAFKLRPDFAEKLDQDIPMFLYHCYDDEVVAFSHLDIYRQQLPWATFREISVGGHQFGEDLFIVAEDIKLL